MPRTRLGGLTAAVLAGIAATVVLTSAAFASPVCTADTCTTTISYKGSVEEWTVPSRITSLTIVAEGAGGGATLGSGGGSGAKVTSTLTVTEAEKLKLVVGGGGNEIVSGGYGGGGAGGASTFSGSGGGGGSFVFSESGSLLIAAGGGGGNANEVGTTGGAGGQTGGAGQGHSTPGGGGGTASKGGGAGNHATAGGGPTTSTTIQGTGGRGGEQAGEGLGGGGGGGGYYGGGGGGVNAEAVDASGGGGGGSSTVNGGVGTVYESGRGGAGAGEFENGQNGTILISYAQEATAAALHASSAHPAVGSPVKYTATVSPVPTSGTVAFTDGGTAISHCNAQTVNTTTGEATCEITYATAGVHTIAAKYSGSTDSVYEPSTSGSETVVATTSTTTMLAASSSSPTLDVPVTYTATVSPVPNSGTVAFTDEGAPLPRCEAQPVNTTTGEATCEVTYETPDAYQIVAEYSGSTDTSYQSSHSAGKEVLAKVPTTTTLAASSNTPAVGKPVTYTATVWPVPTSGTVSFMEGETAIPGCSEQAVSPITGQATCEVTYETPGVHLIAAQFSGSHDALYMASTTASQMQVTASAITSPAAKTEPAVTTAATVPTGTTTTKPAVRRTPVPKLRLRLLRDGPQGLINSHAFDAWVTCGAAPCTVRAAASVTLPNRSRPLRIIGGAGTLAAGGVQPLKLLIPKHLRKLVRHYLVHNRHYQVKIEIILTTGSGPTTQTVHTMIPIWTFPGFR